MRSAAPLISPTAPAPTVLVPKASVALPHLERADRPLDALLGRQIAEVLDRHYPGWLWSVEFPPEPPVQDVVIIRNLDCDPRGRIGFVLRKSRLSGGTLARTVMLAGGEFLEKYRMRRAGFRMEEISGRRMALEGPQS